MYYKDKGWFKKNSNLLLWISRLPWGLESPSWTFFNSPFRVDFKNVHFCIIWWNLDWDIGKILQGHDFKSTFFCLILNEYLSTHNPQWALKSTRKCSIALIGTEEHWRVLCHGTSNYLECSRGFIWSHECSSAWFKI